MAVRAQVRCIGTAALAAVLLATFLYLASPAAANKHIVGGRRRWSPGVNYTDWAAANRFYLYDWLVFFYQKGMYDVVQVRNESVYNQCMADDPVLNWSRGHSFAMQLNHTGRYYFICSRGYCYSGMKLAIDVEPLPPPPLASPPLSPSAAASRLGALWAAAGAAFAVLL